MFSMNFPCGVDSNQKLGNFKPSNLFVSSKYIILPPSTELRARRSGCQERILSASPFSILCNISLKIGLPGIFADCFSINSRAMSRFSLLAKSRNSCNCASIDNICLSSTSVDLRVYKKNFCDIYIHSNKNYF